MNFKPIILRPFQLIVFFYFLFHFSLSLSFFSILSSLSLTYLITLAVGISILQYNSRYFSDRLKKQAGSLSRILSVTSPGLVLLLGFSCLSKYSNQRALVYGQALSQSLILMAIVGVYLAGFANKFILNQLLIYWQTNQRVSFVSIVSCPTQVFSTAFISNRGVQLSG